MSYFVYVLYSVSTDTYYKGQTNDLKSRISRHNRGYENYTSKGRPWSLVWYTSKETRSDARKLERKLKNLSVERLKLFIRKYPIEELDIVLDVFDPWGQ